MQERHPEISLGHLCQLFGYSRQAYYKHFRKDAQDTFLEYAVLNIVSQYRKQMPRIGARKLCHELQSKGVQIGRDKLFALLRKNELLVKSSKKKVFTTQSNHRFHKYPNLTKNMKVEQCNILWVSDITYIDTLEGFVYLFLITDAYSRKIVGYHLNRYLKADGGVDSLNMALASVKSCRTKSIIHHSDRGVQYCSNRYTQILKANKVRISMTEQGDPYENALAERVNGILKTEWIYVEDMYRDFEQAKDRIAEIIHIYNTQRPHSSCDMMTPEKAHTMKGELKKHWKANSKKKEVFYV